jgi:ELWxxDGT repeat protein
LANKTGLRKRSLRCEPLENRCVLAASAEVAISAAALGVGPSLSPLVELNGEIYFAASGSIWHTDGTQAGTTLAWQPAPSSAGATNPFYANGALYFQTSATVNNNNGTNTSTFTVYRWDGTPTGADAVFSRSATYPRFPGASGPKVDPPFRVGEQVLFCYDKTMYAIADAASDPVVVYEFAQAPVMNHALVAGNSVYFQASDGTVPDRWWKTDGTSGGTVMIDFAGTSSGGFPVIFNGMLYMEQFDAAHGVELWKTDGTPGGTSRVADINPGPANTTFSLGSLVVGDTLFFGANDGVHGAELWKTDGTAAGTSLVADIAPGSANAFNGSAAWASMGGNLYFFANDGVHGEELWKSDGTMLVKDISPSGLPQNAGIYATSDTVYFSRNDGIHGIETWQTDGTEEGTVLAFDLNPGPGNGTISALRVIQGNAYFNAFNNTATSAYYRLIPNAKPVADAGSDYSIEEGDAVVLDASLSSDANLTDVLSFSWDLNDDGVFGDATGINPTVSWTQLSALGIADAPVTTPIRVKVNDGAGGVTISAPVNLAVSNAAPSAGQVDLTGDLVWTGTAGDDSVQFEQIDATTIRVTTTLENGVATNFVQTISGVTGIVKASGLAGNDTLDASQLDDVSATLDGGTGNNTLFGGDANDILIGGGNVAPKHNGPEGQQGNNIVVGGAGDDTIYGNATNGAEGRGGNNILLGGAGNDTIYGNWTNGGEGGGRNIIVGGADADTLYDYKIADGAEGKGSILIADDLDVSLGVPELSQVMLEWSSTHTYTDRVNNILGPGSIGRLNGSAYLQPGGNVTSDAAVDHLWGTTTGAAFNWFLYTLSVDEINRDKSGETHSLTS